MPRPKLYETHEEYLESRRAFYRANKERIIASTTKNNQKVVARRKDLLSEYCCRSCNNNDPDVIQWHHVDPNTKEFELFRTNWNEDKFWNEVLKCIPLCANCHLKIHKEKLCLIPLR